MTGMLRNRIIPAMVLVLILSLLYPVLSGEQAVAGSNGTRSISTLSAGDQVVDPTWEWEFKTGDGYIYIEGDETKPVVWIVVAKDHYTGAAAGSVTGSHVTLITAEGLVGRHAYDNSTDRGDIVNGSNHWGNSGSPNATVGVRKFLNGSSYSGDDENAYEVTFYDAMSAGFKSAVLTTTIPHKIWNTGEEYTTLDKVFLPSQTELGGGDHNTQEIGVDWGYFTDHDSRIAGGNLNYWTRSPSLFFPTSLRYIANDGLMSRAASYDDVNVRPVVNLASEALVSAEPDENGVYEFLGLPEGNGTPGDGSGEGCYIATAVYGSRDAREVKILRNFKDEVLQNSLPGRLLIKVYYTLSPPLANYLEEAETLNNWARKVLDSIVELISSLSEE